MVPGAFVVHDRHLSFGEDGSRTVLKSSLIGFALAEYSNGDNVEPVPLTFADECMAKAERLQARTAATSARPAATSARKRRRPASPRTLPSRTNRSSRTSTVLRNLLQRIQCYNYNTNSITNGLACGVLSLPRYWFPPISPGAGGIVQSDGS